MLTSSPSPSPPARDWVQRNGKWLVPLLGLTALAVLGAFLTCIFALMKSSDAYVGALARVRSSPAVVAELGEPIRAGFLVSGTINTSGSSGKADLTIPIAGPKGSATMYVDASKSLGEWYFTHVFVEVDKTKRRIEVSEETTPSAPKSGSAHFGGRGPI